eukprot:418312_1
MIHKSFWPSLMYNSQISTFINCCIKKTNQDKSYKLKSCCRFNEFASIPAIVSPTLISWRYFPSTDNLDNESISQVLHKAATKSFSALFFLTFIFSTILSSLSIYIVYKKQEIISNKKDHKPNHNRWTKRMERNGVYIALCSSMLAWFSVLLLIYFDIKSFPKIHFIVEMVMILLLLAFAISHIYLTLRQKYYDWRESNSNFIYKLFSSIEGLFFLVIIAFIIIQICTYALKYIEDLSIVFHPIKTLPNGGYKHEWEAFRGTLLYFQGMALTLYRDVIHNIIKNIKNKCFKIFNKQKLHSTNRQICQLNNIVHNNSDVFIDSPTEETDYESSSSTDYSYCSFSYSHIDMHTDSEHGIFDDL